MPNPGWVPFAERIPLTPYAAGNDGFGAFVLHVVEGSGQSCIATFRAGNPFSHFLNMEDGRLIQFCSIYDAACANGLSWSGQSWFDPEHRPVTPPWKGLRPNLDLRSNPNYYTISMEEAGWHNRPRTPAQIATRARLLQWLGDTLGQVWTPMQNLIGHCHISPVSRQFCPGPFVDFNQVAAAGNERPFVGSVTVLADVARIRQGPGTGFPVADRVSAGARLGIDNGLMGEVVNGTPLWFHLKSGLGFIHSSLVKVSA